MALTRKQAFQIQPTDGALGAEILGLDLSQPLAEPVGRQLRAHLSQVGVLIFHDQTLSDGDQVNFTHHFGTPVAHIREQPQRPVKEIFLVSNVRENGKPIGALGNEEIAFHSDLSYLKRPGTTSILYAVEIPRTGGATQWCNCAAAYTALEPALKTQLRGLRAVHRHPVAQQNPSEPVAHPVVRTLPETGRPSLYVSPHFTKYIVDWNHDDSHRLLTMLHSHMAQPLFVWTHEWHVGDVVVWDNRSTMHRRLWFPPSERRILKRTQIFNSDDIPYEGRE